MDDHGNISRQVNYNIRVRARMRVCETHY